MVIKPTAISFMLIILYAATAEARGWRGIVPLHSTRSQVEQLLGPPTKQINNSSVVYKTPNETVTIYYANGQPCGIGEKYGQWRVVANTVTEIFISPIAELPLSQFTIDESRYKKIRGGHVGDTRYISASEGEVLTVLGNVVRSIRYFPAAEDSHLQCPGLPKADIANCEYVPEPFDSLGDMSFEQEKQRLDNFVFKLVHKNARAYLIAYGGKRARPDEAMRRANRAKHYLVAVRHFPEGHIKVIDGGYRERRDLVVYVLFEGVCPPTPSPTVDPRDVQLIKR